MNSLLLFGLVEGVWGALQLFGVVSSGHMRYPVTGSFYNPGPYGCLIGALLPVALFVYLRVRRRWQRVLPLLYFVVAALVLPGGMSRTGWAGALAGMAVVLAGLYGRRLRQRLSVRQLWLAGCAALVVLAALAVGAYSLKPDSAAGRLLMWKVGCMAVSTGGVGWENVAGAYGNAQETYFGLCLGSPREHMLAGTPAYVFNEYIQLAIAYGWPVALLAVGVLALALLLYWRRGEYGCCGALAAVAVVCMASYPFQFVEFKVLVVVLIGGGLMQIGRPPVRYAALAAWIAVGVIFVCATGPVNVEADFNRAKRLQQLERYEESNALLYEVLRKTSDPMPLNLLGQNYQAMGQYKKAERCFKRSAWRVPNRVYPIYQLMLLYDEQGENIFTHMYAKRLLYTEPKTHSTAVDQMRAHARAILDTLSMPMPPDDGLFR